MAMPFRSFNEIFNSLTQPTDKQYGGGAEAGGLTSTQAAPQGEQVAPMGAQADSQPQQQQVQTPDFRYQSQDRAVAGAPYSGAGILAPIRRGAAETRSGLQGAVNEFQAQAGPSRSYQGLGGEEKLRSAIEEGRGIEEAKGLASAQYAGPRKLSQESLDKLSGGAEALRSRAQGLQAGQIGTQALLAEAVPGLTRGQRRFEANLLHQDPEYLKAQREAVKEAQMTSDLFGQRQREAEAFGTQRAGEEEDIRKQTQAYLDARRKGIESSLTGKMTAAEKQQVDALAAYQKFQESGNVEDLAALVPDANRLNTDTRRLVEEARAKSAEIDAAYQDIKDVPLMELRINSHGREVLGLPDEWWSEQLKSGKTAAELNAIKARAQERQDALENAGFGGTAAQGGANTYADIAPLYFQENIGGAYDLPELDPYVSFTAGSAVTRGSVASPEERDRINRIDEILGNLDRMAVESPVRAASVLADIDRYLSEEEAAIAERGGARTAAEEDWAKQVHKARHKYKKSQQFYNKAVGKASKIAGKAPIVGKIGEKTVGGTGKLAGDLGSKTSEKTGAKKIAASSKDEASRNIERGQNEAGRNLEPLAEISEEEMARILQEEDRKRRAVA